MVHLEVVKMVHFMLYTFYHNKPSKEITEKNLQEVSCGIASSFSKNRDKECISLSTEKQE